MQRCISGATADVDSSLSWKLGDLLHWLDPPFPPSTAKVQFIFHAEYMINIVVKYARWSLGEIFGNFNTLILHKIITELSSRQKPD